MFCSFVLGHLVILLLLLLTQGMPDLPHLLVQLRTLSLFETLLFLHLASIGLHEEHEGVERFLDVRFSVVLGYPLPMWFLPGLLLVSSVMIVSVRLGERSGQGSDGVRAGRDGETGERKDWIGSLQSSTSLGSQ